MGGICQRYHSLWIQTLSEKISNPPKNSKLYPSPTSFQKVLGSIGTGKPIKNTSEFQPFPSLVPSWRAVPLGRTATAAKAHGRSLNAIRSTEMDGGFLWSSPKVAELTMVYCRYNELVTGDYFMVYKPTNITGGAHPVFMPFFPCFSSSNGKLSVIFSFAVVSVVVSQKNLGTQRWFCKILDAIFSVGICGWCFFEFHK